MDQKKISLEMQKNLIALAYRARENAYAPYSNFRVGAALLAENGNLYLGCNVENSAYGPSNCAERTAFFKAVSEGERKFTAIAIVGGKEETHKTCVPCGVCRQVMREFCDPNHFWIYMEDGEGGILEMTLQELFPLGFGPENLK